MRARCSFSNHIAIRHNHNARHRRPGDEWRRFFSTEIQSRTIAVARSSFSNPSKRLWKTVLLSRFASSLGHAICACASHKQPEDRSSISHSLPLRQYVSALGIGAGFLSTARNGCSGSTTTRHDTCDSSLSTIDTVVILRAELESDVIYGSLSETRHKTCQIL